MISSAAVSLIAGYQRWLSPRKGFACAHRVLHRGPSCSEYAKGICRERGFFAALRSLRGRFGECRLAAEALKAGRVLKMSADHPPGEGFVFAGHPTPGTDAGNPEAADAENEKQKKPSSTCNQIGEACNIAACGLEGCSILDGCGAIAACG